MNPWLPPLTLLLLFTSASATQAAVTMQVTLDLHHEAAAANTQAPADHHSRLDVTLGNRILVVRQGGNATIYDFIDRRRIVVDDHDQTRVDYSLYDTIGFRVLEFQNRVNLHKMMVAAKIRNEPLDLVDLEHVLSVSDHPGTALPSLSENGDRNWSNGTRVLLRESLAATPVTAAEATMFAQFVRYVFGAHPLILAELAASQAIPARLVVAHHEIAETIATFTIDGIRKVDDAPIDLSRYHVRLSASDADPLDRILDGATMLNPALVAQAKQRNVEERSAARRDARTFDGFLGLLEWTLLDGGPLPMTPDERTAVLADASSKQLIDVLGAKSKEETAAALPVLVALKIGSPGKGYLLGIFEANDRKALGDVKAARALFIDALSANPLLAGAYKDLGDTLLMSFDMPRAWRCWDAGRSIAPKFPNFEPVDRFEQTLAFGHPEYF